MVFNPRAGSPAPNSVGTAQLQADAVTTAKIADDAVTVDKVEDNVIQDGEQTLNVEFTRTGSTVRQRVIRYEFFKDSANKRNLKTLRVYHNLKTSNATHAATLEMWLDNDGDWDGSDEYTGAGSPNSTASSTSLALEDLYQEVDISGLADGLHVVNVALSIANASETATFDAIEIAPSTKG